MKHIEKKKLSKKQLTSLVLMAALAVLIAVCVPVGIVLANKGNDKPVTPPPEIIDGESIQDGLTVAYPAVNEKSQIKFIEIKNSTGRFGFAKINDETHFTMYYVDGSGERQIYYPKIYIDDATVDYTDFFSIETSDGFSRYPKLDYLCLALQTPYFAHRIALSENEAERAEQLNAYGLAEGEYSSVYFEYTDDKTGETRQMSLKIGEKSVSGTGYYFIVGDRPYVYSSSNNYYDYAVSSFNDFIKALVVADGLREDKGFGPYLTTGYYQWKNEKHSELGESVAPDSKVIAYTDILSSTVTDNAASDGYERDSDLIEIDLKKYKDNSSYRRMITALVGAKNGEQTPKIVFTVSSATNRIEFADAAVKSYQYNIIAIEAILTDSGEITEQGAICSSDYNLIKVTYTSSVDGAATAQHVRHAVLDLTSPALPADAVEKLRTAPIGTLSQSISFTVDYTKQNAISKSGKYIITEIISIYNAEGKKVDTVTETSVVGYRYAVEVEGQIISEDTFVLDLAKVTDPTDVLIKNALIGKGVSRNLSISFGETTAYSEYFLNFATYVISRIDYFITSELISAFRFQNSSQRDPYYGESLYENLMEDEHKLYGLNSGVCEQVVSILGGLSNESSSATAAGLSGDKVIAVGLTPEVMDEYGLYAHTIYFELPRSIYAVSPEQSEDDIYEALDDYAYYSKLGFTLYISDADPVTNTRYIASDMYDIVTRVDASDFVFLNYDFETFWARRNIILMDINDIESIGIQFNMADLGGGYHFDLIHEIASYEPSAGANPQKFNKITVSVTPSDKTQSNKLIAFMNEKGYAEHVSLTELYEAVYGKNDEELRDVYPDSLGTAYFKEVIKMIYLTTYVDLMDESERAAAMQPEKMLMRMTMEIKSSAYEYVYEFYRADDRRVLVSIYKQDMNGNVVTTPVSDFYVSTFAFKKIVSNFVGILNAEKITPNEAYTDEK